LAERFASATGTRVGAHQHALSEFGKRVEHHQPAPGLDRGLVLAGGVLLGAQPLQDLAYRREGAVALSRQPFLEGL